MKTGKKGKSISITAPRARLSRLLAVILALAFIAGFGEIGLIGSSLAAAPPPAESAAQPSGDYYGGYSGDYVWEVRGGRSRVYLMGSMHIVMPEYALNPYVVELLAGCDAVAVESDTQNQEMLDTVSAMVRYPKGENLYDHLSPRGRAHIEWLCKQYGLTPLHLANVKSFEATSAFSQMVTSSLGFSFEGVDDLIQAEAQALGKPILELEDGVALYERFLSLPDDTIERKCILTSRGPEETAYSLMALYMYYISGQADIALAETEYDNAEVIGGDGLPIEFEEKDALYEQYMYADRNNAWAKRISTWLETPDRDVFIVAGLAHFAGGGSVVELLEARGYEVERVQMPVESALEAA